MAPSMQQSTMAALAIGGCAAASTSSNSAFVSLPAAGQKDVPVEQHLRGLSSSAPSNAAASQSSSVLTSVGVALGATALAASARRLQRKDALGSHSRGVTSVRAFENELGVQPPVGFWDPAGFTSDGDPREFYRRRLIEIKHGRVSMLACLGYITQEFVRFPGYLSPSSAIKFADVPNGLNGVTKVPAVGWFQYTVFCGICELWLMHQVPENPPGKLCTRLWGEEATNYGYGSIGVPNYLGGKSIDDPELKKKKLNAELANGRLAMMAIIGMFFQDGLTGSAWGDWANYTESPLRAFENELGVQAPTGFFDPLGFTKDGDVEAFRRRREVEIKNGRVAMFATIGYITPEYFKFPGYLAPSINLKFEDVPNGLGAFSKVPAEGWIQWVALCGLYEVVVNGESDPNEPGNYGKGRLGMGNMVAGIKGESIADPEARKRGLNSEIANGRLAMMAITGMWFQDGLTGCAWGDWGNYVDSPLRAFESELGVQPPVGFWDPLGFTTGGEAAAFRRRRYIELKHGRVCMLACLGYIVPEYYRLPGELSPSLGLKFTDVGNGFAAFSKVPLSGWAQMVAFAGTVELFQYVDDPKRPPGDFENAGLLGVPNGFLKCPEDQKQKKLAAEIANGRLAMMAIIGMFFQDGLTGSAWGDWANYSDSPLRANAKELLGDTGGPFPENFWDPAGITNNKTEQEILELRAIELKHGRVAMLATVGWFTNASGNHPIGDYAVGVPLSNDPIVALTQMPMASVWQVVFTILCLEWLTTYVCKPPADRPWDVLGWKDILATTENPEWKQAEQRELNNGRLAMVAIVGLILGEMMSGEYGEFIGKFCGGSSLCDGLETGVASDGGPPKMVEMIPPTPYKYPPLYPRAWGLHAPGSPQFLQ